MDFAQFIKNSKGLEDTGLSTEVLQPLLERLEQHGTLTYSEMQHTAIPIEALRRLLEGWMPYSEWLKRVHLFKERIAQETERPIPESVLAKATIIGSLDALSRAVCYFKELKVDLDEQEWQGGLETALALWEGCFLIARSEALLNSQPGSDTSATTSPSDYDDYINRKESIEDIPGHRIMAYIRGEKEGMLKLSIAYPQEALEAHTTAVVAVHSQPGSALASDCGELLRRVVIEGLDKAIRDDLEGRASAQSIRIAATAYRELLSTNPLSSIRKVGAVSVGGPFSPLGVALVDEQGRILKYKVVANGPYCIDEALAILRRAEAVKVVAPNKAMDQKRLNRLVTALEAEWPLIRIRSAGLADARFALEEGDTDLPRAAASAVILARRAITPLSEWTKVDPVCLGLAPYQADLNPDTLRRSLQLEENLVRLEIGQALLKPGQTVTRLDSGKALALGKKLNPLLSSIDDLRPGMVLEGVVTNIAPFGAFVNMGLSTEGLVHISQFSDSFVDNPTLLVSPGQQVTVHVMGVDRERGRISLSMKPPQMADADCSKRQKTSQRMGSKTGNDTSSSYRSKGDKQGARSPGGRGAAFQKLEDLFKK